MLGAILRQIQVSHGYAVPSHLDAEPEARHADAEADELTYLRWARRLGLLK